MTRFESLAPRLSQVLDRRDTDGFRARTLNGGPLVTAGWRAMSLAALAASAFAAVVGYAAHLLSAARRIRRENDLLQSLGATRRQGSVRLALENLVIVVVGMALGAWAGLLMSELFVPALSPSGAPVPPVLVTTDWTVLGAFWAVEAAVFAAMLLLFGRSIARSGASLDPGRSPVMQGRAERLAASAWLIFKRSLANWRSLLPLVAGLVLASAIMAGTTIYYDALNNLAFSRRALVEHAPEDLDILAVHRQRPTSFDVYRRNRRIRRVAGRTSTVMAARWEHPRRQVRDHGPGRTRGRVVGWRGRPPGILRRSAAALQPRDSPHRRVSSPPAAPAGSRQSHGNRGYRPRRTWPTSWT